MKKIFQISRQHVPGKMFPQIIFWNCSRLKGFRTFPAKWFFEIFPPNNFPPNVYYKIAPAKCFFWKWWGASKLICFWVIDFCFWTRVVGPPQHASACNTIEKPANGRGGYFKQVLVRTFCPSTSSVLQQFHVEIWWQEIDAMGTYVGISVTDRQTDRDRN